MAQRSIKTLSNPSDRRADEPASDASYLCDLALLAEDDGTFSVLVLNLPGTGSCGDTEEEALANVREALAGVVHSYLDEGEQVPWIDSASIAVPEGAVHRQLAVNV